VQQLQHHYEHLADNTVNGFDTRQKEITRTKHMHAGPGKPQHMLQSRLVLK
jgi:hypothetical protein